MHKARLSKRLLYTLHKIVTKTLEKKIGGKYIKMYKTMGRWGHSEWLIFIFITILQSFLKPGGIEPWCPYSQRPCTQGLVGAPRAGAGPGVSCKLRPKGELEALQGWGMGAELPAEGAGGVSTLGP